LFVRVHIFIRVNIVRVNAWGRIGVHVTALAAVVNDSGTALFPIVLTLLFAYSACNVLRGNRGMNSIIPQAPWRVAQHLKFFIGLQLDMAN
jgi:hypothetical protein